MLSICSVWPVRPVSSRSECNVQPRERGKMTSVQSLSQPMMSWTTLVPCCWIYLILKWNSWVLRTGSDQNGPAHGSEPLSSPASGRTKRGNLESYGGKKCKRTPWIFPFKLARTSSFRAARTENWKVIVDWLLENSWKVGKMSLSHILTKPYIDRYYCNLHWLGRKACVPNTVVSAWRYTSWSL